MNEAAPFEPLASARSILRSARSASLGTLDGEGSPFVSLVTFALLPDLSPVLSLSDLAVHTKNLMQDSRASLLFVAPGGEDGNPLAGARLTLTGVLEPTEDERAAWRFRALNGEGATRFADFRFWRLKPSAGHLVAGFGRIVSIEAEDLLLDLSDTADLVAGERMIVEHMNDDHLEAISLYAEQLLGLDRSDWRMSGCDPDGIDLVSKAGRARLAFPERARTVADAGGFLKSLARQARERAANATPRPSN